MTDYQKIILLSIECILSVINSMTKITTEKQIEAREKYIKSTLNLIRYAIEKDSFKKQKKQQDNFIHDMETQGFI